VKYSDSRAELQLQHHRCQHHHHHQRRRQRHRITATNGGDVVDWIRRLCGRPRTTINLANLQLKRTPTAAFVADIAWVALPVLSSGGRSTTHRLKQRNGRGLSAHSRRQVGPAKRSVCASATVLQVFEQMMSAKMCRKKKRCSKQPNAVRTVRNSVMSRVVSRDSAMTIQ